jgi:Zn-dependent oligopeptidase
VFSACAATSSAGAAAPGSGDPAAWQAAQAEVQAIASNPAAPTFDNTLAALQNGGRHLERATLAAAGMRNIILAEGNSSDRAEAYRRFRGRDPGVNALLRVRGFPTGAAGGGR